MKSRWISDMDFYKIKVNKKNTHNISRVKNTVLNSYLDFLNISKISNIYPNITQLTRSAYSSKNKNIYLNNNSNSEEKLKRNNLHINCVEDNVLLNKEGNILDDLINNKYLKPILESTDIDEKLLNCNLKEPVKNNFNVSLNDFFNRRKKYMNFKTPKPELNRIRNLSINNSNNNSGFLIQNRTLENHYMNQNMNRKINNNYYNDIKLTNNFYNNYNKNEINILNNNQPYYNNNNIRINNLCSSAVRKKLKKYFSNTNSNERNNYNNPKISPDLHLFKSQTYTQKEPNFSQNLYKYVKNNKEINIKSEEINEDDNMNKKYNDIKNIIKYNNKYDYSKKLFDIYRGKLVKEFLKHIQKGINKYLLNIFKHLTQTIKNKNSQKKIDEIFIPKIYLEKPNNNNIIRESANTSKSNFLQIFNSDKKNYQRYSNNISRITEYKRYKNNININNSAIISNNNLIKTNRNSIILDENKNNIQIIKLNSSINNNNSGLIYKKKKLAKNNMHIKKSDILSNSRGKIIDIDINLGKPIREISDINIMESKLFLNDYNNIRKKKFKSSLSTNKREKRKMKNKSKKKKLSLPKKKYLEEISSSSSEKYIDNNNNDNSFDKNINNNFTIKTNNNIIQPLIYKTSKINKKTKNILEKNIVTSDKRLFININYISNLSYENKSRSKSKYKNTSLTIKRNIYFPIFSQKVLKNKTVSNNYFFISNNSRNSNKNLEIQNKKMNMTNYININNDKNKYLNSCIKFIVKNINKVFLRKDFKIFLKRINTIQKGNKNGQKINRINAYKRKVGKNKN